MNKITKILLMALGVLPFSAAGTSQVYAQPSPISSCTTITQPGSYVVTNNILATPYNVQHVGYGVACIGITANFVTLDLAGFAITAFNLPATPYEQAIRGDDVDLIGIKVHSGTISNFPGGAVQLTGHGHTVEHIIAMHNHGGIVVTAFTPGGPNGNRIIGNIVLSNTMGGIEVACPSVVVGNVAAGNGGAGPQIFEEPAPSSTGPCINAQNSPSLP